MDRVAESASGPRETPTRRCRFGPLRLVYDDEVLEPRSWTLAQSLWAAELSATLPPGPVVELCSGAGQIGLAAARLTGRVAVLVDQDPRAGRFARANALSAGVTAQIRCAPVERALEPDERFPLILADPPWVPSLDVARFPRDPVTAIDGGPDGLTPALACLDVVADHLAEVGAAVLQLGTRAQADRLTASIRARGLRACGLRVFDRGVLLLVQRRAA